jgi:hypothetical protein
MRHARSFVFAIAIFIVVTPALAFEASCDSRKCMVICRDEYESGCAGMCGRIISLCRQLVLKPERPRNVKRVYRAHGRMKLDAQARNFLGRVD